MQLQSSFTRVVIALTSFQLIFAQHAFAIGSTRERLQVEVLNQQKIIEAALALRDRLDTGEEIDSLDSKELFVKSVLSGYQNHFSEFEKDVQNWPDEKVESRLKEVRESLRKQPTSKAALYMTELTHSGLSNREILVETAAYIGQQSLIHQIDIQLVYHKNPRAFLRSVTEELISKSAQRYFPEGEEDLPPEEKPKANLLDVTANTGVIIFILWALDKGGGWTTFGEVVLGSYIIFIIWTLIQVRGIL